MGVLAYRLLNADFFRDYGVINDAWVARKPPGFGFVFFDSERDAVPKIIFECEYTCTNAEHIYIEQNGY